MAQRDISDIGSEEQTGNSPTSTECPECQGTLQTENGERCCSDCGLILDESRLDHRGRRIFPEDETSRKRTGAPLTPARHDRGLSTEIGHMTDGSGQTLPGHKRRQLARLRREHRRAQWQSTAERNLAHGCGEIARLVGSLGLPRDIRDQASQLFRTAQDEDLLRGRSVEAIAAGCVYATCRCTDVTRTLAEIGTVAQCSLSRVKNAYSVLNTELGLPAPPQHPREFIAAHASALDIPSETEHLARQIAIDAEETGLSIGAHPSGFAAACLAVAADRHSVEVRQSDLAAAADVSPATVRTHRERVQATLLE